MFILVYNFCNFWRKLKRKMSWLLSIVLDSVFIVKIMDCVY